MISTTLNFQKVILAACEEVQSAPAGQAVALGPDTALLGQSAVLDSLGLVSVIAIVESNLEVELGFPIVLASEKAMSRSKSPFRTIASFADYIKEVVEEAQGTGT